MTAAEQIDKVRRGEAAGVDASAFVKGGAVDPAALALLVRALRDAEGSPREQLVDALVEVGRAADPLGSRGYPLIRSPEVIAAFVDPGLAAHGRARDAALQALAGNVPPALLAPHGKALAADLKRWPDDLALVVVAKAKPPEARPVVDALKGSNDLGDALELKVAQAALGDAGAEDELVKPFLETMDPEEKMDRAKPLGQAGTPGTLKALAGEMRTPLVYEMTGTFRKSVRLAIMEALAYNFPDQVFLYENALESDEDYARVEAFCERQFGVRWTSPRPPFLRNEGIPQEP